MWGRFCALWVFLGTMMIVDYSLTTMRWNAAIDTSYYPEDWDRWHGPVSK